MSDFGIKISQPGIDASKTNNPNSLTLNMKYPFHKLDVTKAVSFQNINIAIKNNPPGPNLAPGGYIDTLTQKTVLYQFPHGYNYAPTTWFLTQNNITNMGYGPVTGLNYQGRFTLVGTAADATLGNSLCFVLAEVDNTNVTISAVQELQPFGIAPGPPAISMVGMVFKMRVYVFAEQLAPAS